MNQSPQLFQQANPNTTTTTRSTVPTPPSIPGKDVVNVTDSSSFPRTFAPQISPPSYLQATSSASPEAETTKTTFSKAKVVGGASAATLVFQSVESQSYGARESMGYEDGRV
ncbi:hypothetical protein ARMGADRAFT_1028212 [Armillaria gallica]|uniref:Uncharacterized protein n=1 Tax=Armillaria gallica TaxID=47427 RepID=A0A2H3E5Y2_ARMGA|nr:hypothetical protein ARMGADRAFT_1028212 [Armillaria gallica]